MITEMEYHKAQYCSLLYMLPSRYINRKHCSAAVLLLCLCCYDEGAQFYISSRPDKTFTKSFTKFAIHKINRMHSWYKKKTGWL